MIGSSKFSFPLSVIFGRLCNAKIFRMIAFILLVNATSSTKFFVDFKGPFIARSK